MAVEEEEEKEVSTTEKKYEHLEDLPGVGPATAQKLRELGFNTVESLATATIKELEPAGIGEKKAADLIRVARSSISVSFIRADELLKQRQCGHGCTWKTNSPPGSKQTPEEVAVPEKDRILGIALAGGDDEGACGVEHPPGPGDQPSSLHRLQS